MLSSKLQTGLDMYWLKQEDTSGTAGFESLAAQCVTDGSLCYFGPSCYFGPCRSFTRSPRVVLGFLLTVLVIILTPRGEILRGAPDRGRLSVVLYVFHFLIIAPTVDFFTPSCLPIADSVFPAWCRSTILFLVSFDCSLDLDIVEFGDCLRLWTGVFYTDNEFKQMPLIQVTSGGQRSLLKKKLQVCESQQSCLFVGDQILIFHHNLLMNSLKILQRDFLDFFSYFVSHS